MKQYDTTKEFCTHQISRRIEAINLYRCLYDIYFGSIYPKHRLCVGIKSMTEQEYPYRNLKRAIPAHHRQGQPPAFIILNYFKPYQPISGKFQELFTTSLSSKATCSTVGVEYSCFITLPPCRNSYLPHRCKA